MLLLVQPVMLYRSGLEWQQCVGWLAAPCLLHVDDALSDAVMTCDMGSTMFASVRMIVLCAAAQHSCLCCTGCYRLGLVVLVLSVAQELATDKQLQICTLFALVLNTALHLPGMHRNCLVCT